LGPQHRTQTGTLALSDLQRGHKARDCWEVNSVGQGCERFSARSARSQILKDMAHLIAQRSRMQSIHRDCECSPEIGSGLKRERQYIEQERERSKHLAFAAFRMIAKPDQWQQSAKARGAQDY
jgi:hypothetical protein